MIAMNLKRCVLAGGSGFLGTALAATLVDWGYQVTVLTRTPTKDSHAVQYVKWDGRSLGPWQDTLEGAAAVVNFTGKSVNCRYTAENRRKIVSSRVESVGIIGKAIRNCSTPPKAWVQCASTAIYGDAGEQVCDEDTKAAVGFSPETCQTWEQSFASDMVPATRKVLLRIGFVLAPNEGALGTLSRIARFYLGGTVGSGRQYISWLHIQDLNQIFIGAVERSDLEGVFNVCSPNPVTNKTFMTELRRSLHRPWSPPVPAWAVRFGSILMGTEAELALTGRRCAPKRLLEKGVVFSFPEISGALKNLYR